MNLPPDLNLSHVNTEVATDDGYQLRASSTAATVSVLTNANNIHIKNSSLNVIANINTAGKPTLDLLYQRVAPNAILNEGGRADDAKCHPGTREEVIGLIEKWMNARDSDRIMWLSGPAGSGKTAIIKTIAKRSAKRGVQTVNFFFFRGDFTRNTAQPVIPTLLYQLFELYPPSLEAIEKIISARPRILDGSNTEQCKLVSTLSPIIRQCSSTGSAVILVVDGLDECDVDAESSQGDILRALERVVEENNSPFRLLIASRPEARIQMTFNQLSSHARTIFLDEQYSPENDIRLFVTAEFDKIKASHPTAGSLTSDWPSLSDVQQIVWKSSGQFIYAATVMRYIAHASIVPSLSLERVKGIAPASKNSPFAHLDSIYMFILSRAEDQDATRDIMSMSFLLSGLDKSMFFQDLVLHYNPRYSFVLVESCISDLSAISKLAATGGLQFYHASLEDFLVDQARSGTHWINVDAFRAKVLMVLWEKPRIRLGYNSLQLELFGDLKRPTSDLKDVLLNSAFPEWVTTEFIRGPLWRQGQARFWKAMYRLFYKDDIKTYKLIIRRFIRVLMDLGVSPSDVAELSGAQVPYAREYLRFYDTWRWWFGFINVIYRRK